VNEAEKGPRSRLLRGTQVAAELLDAKNKCGV
jgi:hypothetical protein